MDGLDEASYEESSKQSEDFANDAKNSHSRSAIQDHLKLSMQDEK